jgi:hypothetical protein
LAGRALHQKSESDNGGGRMGVVTTAAIITGSAAVLAALGTQIIPNIFAGRREAKQLVHERQLKGWSWRTDGRGNVGRSVRAHLLEITATIKTDEPYRIDDLAEVVTQVHVVAGSGRVMREEAQLWLARAPIRKLEVKYACSKRRESRVAFGRYAFVAGIPVYRKFATSRCLRKNSDSVKHSRGHKLVSRRVHSESSRFRRQGRWSRPAHPYTDPGAGLRLALEPMTQENREAA